MLHGIAMASLAACHSDPVAGSDANTEDAATDDGVCAPEPLDATDDAQADCSTFVTLPCGMPEGSTVAECFPDLETCFDVCGTNELFYCVLTSSACNLDAGILDAPTTLECVSCLGGGRRPRGLVAPRARSLRSFAALAHMEAASVRAFRDLECALAFHRAPRALVLAARRARLDESRHARAMTRLANRFGERRERARVRRVPMPTLVELLEDGAVEGCVNETVGAVILAVRAERSHEPRIRKTLARIARDESRHAALAWEILRWGLPHISTVSRERVRARLASAFDAMKNQSPLTQTIARAVRAATANEITW